MELQDEIKSAKFTAARDVTITSDDGGQRAIFKAGQTREIGKRLFNAALSSGLIPETPLQLEPAPPQNKTREEVVTVGLLEACKQLIESAKKEDFTSVGQPRVPSVKKLVDFDFTRKEMLEAFELAMHEVEQDGNDSTEHSESSSEPAE